MKLGRLDVQLSDRQHLLLALLLVLLLAISMLYCLGFASLVLRQAAEDTRFPWGGGTYLPSETADATSILPVEEPAPWPTAAP